MATVTGLTADRMLAIEAASVVDGDVDASGNLILTQKGGTQINAGSVQGPPGPQGPVGSMLSVITAQPVLDVGIINQIRAGRQLTAADFTNMGLSAPVGLWNLSDLSDASGNGRALSNKGTVGFASGINGGANTAVQFTGSTAQVLYIPDSGAADPFRIRTGSWGCWFKTAKLGVAQYLVTKFGSAGNVPVLDFSIYVDSTNVLSANISDGVNAYPLQGVSNIADDRWHFGAVTSDGASFKIYVDGMLEGSRNGAPMLIIAAPLNIGAFGGDAATNAAGPHFGRIDEAFVTADVLSEDQIRNLYCVKIPHTLAATPARFTLNVRRRRRGAALAVADFPAQPLRLHNFSAGSLGDEGSNGVALINGGAVSIAGVDGSSGNAFSFPGSVATLAATDAGLPVNTRSSGCWFKTTSNSSGIALYSWGAAPASTRTVVYLNTGALSSVSGANGMAGPVLNDGEWHFVVIVEDNGSVDNVKGKMYVDGVLKASTNVYTALILGGVNRFRIGSDTDGSLIFNGAIDGVFVCDYALTPSQITMLYAKSLLTLSPSPKNPGDHIEGADANNLFAIFNTLEPQHQVDLKVAS